MTEFDTWKEYERFVKTTLTPKIDESDVFIAIYDGSADLKMATEMGYALLTGKPILLVALRIDEVPPALQRVAVHIIRADDMGSSTFQAKLQHALDVIDPRD